MTRFLDIFLSLFALFVLSPILLPLMLFLRLTGEGEIFYKQQRIGVGGGQFGVFKFATMLKNSPSIGTGTITIKGDPRILPAGQFLRKTKLNELPQLLNILLGDMSLIGPRPMTPENFDAYPERVRSSLIRVRPGLSGIGSIVFRDEESMLGEGPDARRVHSLVIAPYKAELEAWYVDHRSVFTYISLICLTIWVVLSPRSKVVWAFFPSLPRPTGEMLDLLTAGGAAP